MSFIAPCKPSPRIARSPRRGKLVNIALIFMVGAGFAGCTSGGKKIQTTAQIHASNSEETRHFIFYRTLAREDFRADKPPPESAQHARHLGALLCAAIIPSRELMVEFESERDGDAHSFRIHGPNYRAVMDPECSWWNDQQGGVPADYVLEHEQIHFALSEVYAARINREIEGLRLRVTSWRDAPELAEERANQLLERATVDLVEESRRFDEETSRTAASQVQRAWKQQIEARQNASLGTE